MSYFGTSNYYTDVVLGKVPGASIVTVEGTGTVGTTYVPVSTALVYPTPTAAVSLEVVSSSASDTSAGVGARTVTITGLNASWAEISQTVSMNGVTAVSIPTAMLRVYKVVVATSGTYASATGGSHVGNITVRVAGGGATWATIDISTGFAEGRSAIGVYTIPLGSTGYLLSKVMSIETSKTADLRFFYRSAANTVAAPFSPMSQIEREGVVAGESIHTFVAPIGPFVGPCDIGFMAKVSVGTALCEVEYQLLITTP